MIDLPLIILILSMVVALLGIGFWLFQLLSRKSIFDPSPGKGSDKRGVLYAFTIGMLPWKKESARLHWLVYLRGIFFHVGILAGLLVLLISIFNLTSDNVLSLVLRVLMWSGVISGVAAIVYRAADPRLRGISNRDDYISPVLTTIFMLTGALSEMRLLGTSYFYLATSVLCLYLPWSKVRHCVYFFFSRGNIGAQMGHRGLLRIREGHLAKDIR